MSSAIQAVGNMLSSTANLKAKDLAKDTHDPTDGVLTTDHGVRVHNTDDWLKVVDERHNGPSLLEDQIAREKIHRFDHERIPERVVHARGTAAHGHFTLHTPIPEFSSGAVLNDTSRKTPIIIRFSTVQGSKGSADTVRDVRGFAVKLYTDEGNWDIVGNNIPVFFIQDAIKFPDFVHAVKPEPHNEVPQAQTAHNNFWDFIYLQPESTHMSVWAMSDRAIPRSYRMMQGFGVNTFTLINEAGKRHFVKFHFTPTLGVHSLVWDEALKLAGQDPDFHRKDLMEAIDNGAYPTWQFGIQVISEESQDDFDFDILDATKIWPEELVPLRNIGELCLDRNVDEFFPEVEQLAFCTSHVVPGIGFSDDPLLQGRNFSYFDTQISRLGINWEELPINRPVCPVMNFNRDGRLRHKITKGSVNYWPNRFGILPHGLHHKQPGTYQEYPQTVGGYKMRARGPKFSEHINQAQLFYNSLAPYEKEHVINAYSFELDHCEDPVVYERMCTRLAEIDFDLAKRVATNVGGPIPSAPTRQNHGQRSSRLSNLAFIPKTPTIASRKIAILIADGFSLPAFTAIKTAIFAASAIPVVIGVRRGPVSPADGPPVKPDHHFEGARSTLFDALFIPPGEAHAKTLSWNGRVIHWVREAFGHCKAIGAIGEGISVVQYALPLPDIKLASDETGDQVCESYGVVTASTFTPTSELKEVIFGGGGFIAQFALAISKHRCYEREMDGLVSKVAF